MTLSSLRFISCRLTISVEREHGIISQGFQTPRAQAHWINPDHMSSLDSDYPGLGEMAPSSACVSVYVYECVWYMCMYERECACVHMHYTQILLIKRRGNLIP